MRRLSMGAQKQRPLHTHAQYKLEVLTGKTRGGLTFKLQGHVLITKQMVHVDKEKSKTFEICNIVHFNNKLMIPSLCFN